MLDHIFLELKLDKAWGEVLSGNPGGVRIHKRFGFQEERLLRQHVREQGRFLDVHVLGLLRDDYLKQRNSVITMLRERGVQTE